MKFKSRISGFVYVVLYGTILLMFLPIFPVLLREIRLSTVFILVFIFIIAGLLVWMIHGTYYVLTNDKMIYHCGPLKGAIEIDKIHTIEKGKTSWVGFRPATASGGLVIKYNKYDELYISPHTNQLFIDTILQRNPEIKIHQD